MSILLPDSLGDADFKWESHTLTRLVPSEFGSLPLVGRRMIISRPSRRLSFHLGVVDLGSCGFGAESDDPRRLGLCAKSHRDLDGYLGRFSRVDPRGLNYQTLIHRILRNSESGSLILEAHRCGDCAIEEGLPLLGNQLRLDK